MVYKNAATWRGKCLSLNQHPLRKHVPCLNNHYKVSFIRSITSITKQPSVLQVGQMILMTNNYNWITIITCWIKGTCQTKCDLLDTDMSKIYYYLLDTSTMEMGSTLVSHIKWAEGREQETNMVWRLRDGYTLKHFVNLAKFTHC